MSKSLYYKKYKTKDIRKKIEIERHRYKNNKYNVFISGNNLVEFELDIPCTINNDVKNDGNITFNLDDTHKNLNKFKTFMNKKIKGEICGKIYEIRDDWFVDDVSYKSIFGATSDIVINDTISLNFYIKKRKLSGVIIIDENGERLDTSTLSSLREKLQDKTLYMDSITVDYLHISGNPKIYLTAQKITIKSEDKDDIEKDVFEDETQTDKEDENKKEDIEDMKYFTSSDEEEESGDSD